MSLHHSFDIALAAEFSIEEAILIHHFQHWLYVNRELKQNFIEGRTWTYQKLDFIASHFPYFSKKQVERTIKKLTDRGIIMKNNFNKSPYDRTVWYAFTNERRFLPFIDKSRNREIEIQDSGNENPEIGTPIPDTKPDTKPEKESKKKAPPIPVATAITLNSSTKKLEGISEEDIKRWRETFPSVNVLKELNECLLWALNTPRKNYRKSIDTWMRNVSKSHTEPFKQEIEASTPASEEERVFNKRIGDNWERELAKRPGNGSQQTHGVQSSASKVTFILSEDTFSVEYDIRTNEFLKKCEKGIRRLNLPSPKMND